jgi:hypothetical protein
VGRGIRDSAFVGRPEGVRRVGGDGEINLTKWLEILIMCGMFVVQQTLTGH